MTPQAIPRALALAAALWLGGAAVGAAQTRAQEPAQAAGSTPALSLRLPADARQTAAVGPTPATVKVATGPWQAGILPALDVTGEVTREAWRIGGIPQTTAELAQALARQLEGAGFKILYRCDQDQCGGYDFRYAVLGLREPAMHVDLGNYQYIAAARPTAAGPEYVMLLISRSANAGFVELTRVLPPGSSAPAATVSTPATGSAQGPAQSTGGEAATTCLSVLGPPEEVGAVLESKGRAALSDLEFAPGSARLGPGPYESLAALARYLKAHPNARITLVGHTDATGALEANIALSRKRAQAVRERLIQSYGIAPGRLDAEGVGYLAPIAPNTTEAGRRANRRVEAVVIPSRTK